MNLRAKRVVLGCFCAGALAAVACADGSVSPVSPSASPAVSSLETTGSSAVGSRLSASFPRSGEFHVEKDCPPETYAGQAGGFCTFTSSNLTEIEVGSKVTYAQAADFVNTPPSLDSDVVLDLPGPGNNKVFGHCYLDFSTYSGRCTFSGGTGKFTHFHASAKVSYLAGTTFAWDGTYSFDPRD
jgi:hypothetical protein